MASDHLAVLLVISVLTSFIKSGLIYIKFRGCIYTKSLEI